MQGGIQQKQMSDDVGEKILEPSMITFITIVFAFCKKKMENQNLHIFSYFAQSKQFYLFTYSLLLPRKNIRNVKKYHEL